MAYSISYAPSAAKKLESLSKADKRLAVQLLSAIERLKSDPRPPGCIQLKGGNGEYRVRVGNYRIIYDVIDNELVVLVLKLGHRREGYR